jgi:uncharacterized protein YegP (UPF0339 family)
MHDEPPVSAYLSHPSHIEIRRGNGRLRRWYWHIIASNGRITLTSQSYFSKYNAFRAASKYQHKSGLLLKVSV